MPITKIKITLQAVCVNDGADIWGEAEWMFNATINGKSVGDPAIKWVAEEREVITLPDSDWSAVIDVSAKSKPTDTVKVSFSGKESDTNGDRDLGKVSYTFKYPFSKDQAIRLKSPKLPPGVRYYSLRLKMEVVEIKATKALKGLKSVAVSRQHDGSSTFTTVGGKQFVPRVEVCPVVPVPEAPSKLPKRPDISTALGLTPGKDTPESQPIELWPLPDPNALCNPSLIPILKKSDASFNSKVARLAVTYLEPGDLDTSFVSWHVKSGPVEIVGSNKGPEIKVNGTGAGAADELAELEVRWDGEKGPLLCTYRAWVGRVKRFKYRINLINGNDTSKQVVFSGADYESQIKIAGIIYWQAGIELVPDDNTTCWDGASSTDPSGAALPKGVFNVPVTDDTWTVNVNNFVPTIATRLNFRPGVIHAVYVRSTKTGRAAATDIQGVDGKDYEMPLGKPTSSWVIPSGIPPDKDPTTKLKLVTFPSSNRLSNKAFDKVTLTGRMAAKFGVKLGSDDDYVKARQKVDPGFTPADMGRLYAAVLPSDWAQTGTDSSAGVNAAHELGHVLGLQHRGSGEANLPGSILSNDNINSEDTSGKQRGHPWDENVMTYGYTSPPPRALDIDLIQTPVLRKHPATYYI
jgi:hypothetical protein